MESMEYSPQMPQLWQKQLFIFPNTNYYFYRNDFTLCGNVINIDTRVPKY